MFENSDTRNLAVTSLVADPHIRDRWFRLEPSGEISSLDSQFGILSPDVDIYLDDGYLQVDITHPSTRDTIASLYPRFDTSVFTYY